MNDRFEQVFEWEIRMRNCKSDRERDEVTNYWLQCNDPFYSDERPDKMDRIEYPYLTRNTQKRINELEIQESNINSEGTIELLGKGMAENKEV